MNPRGIQRRFSMLLVGLLTIAGLMLLASGVSSAGAASCLGEKARVLKSGGKVKAGQAVVLTNRKPVKVKAAGGNLICGRGAAVVLKLGAAGTSKVELGSADDKVLLTGTLKGRFDRTVWTGLGNDRVTVSGRGHTTAYLSPKKVTRGARDRDSYSGNMDIDTVFDYGGGTDSKPNLLKGNRGLDYLHSAGSARTDIYGGDGTDYLYAASKGKGKDRLFGERGNDRLDLRSGGRNSNGAYMDGAEGDDWYYGSTGPDTMIALSGIKKIYGGPGNDTIIRSAIGRATIYGQGGRDTLSYMGQIPPGWNRQENGMYIDLGGNSQFGHAAAGDKGEDPVIVSIEHLIGSAFDDRITGRDGDVLIEGGPGDDQIGGRRGNRVDGGLGNDGCSVQGSSEVWPNCGPDDADQVPAPGQKVIELADDGVPLVLGSDGEDEIDFSYDRKAQAFVVETAGEALVSGSCLQVESGTYECPVDPDLLSIAVVSAGTGDDQVNLESIPEHMNTIIDGGEGLDGLSGAESREVTFGVERGRLAGNNDQIWMTADSTLDAGPGSDTVHMTVMCVGGNVKGGPGVRDGVVFAGLKRGVWASMRTGSARYMSGPCPKPFRFADDWEGLEGTRKNDVLIGPKDRGITFLGREGIDVFKARNGKFDKITVGGGGKKNKVIADPIDRIHWDWGYAAF